MRKITVRADERLDREYPARRGARAEILLGDGRRLATAVDLARGEPESPLTAEEIEAKFFALAGDVLGDRAGEVRDRVRNLEKLHDVRELVERLSAPREER
jgi:2-methylcitrate dehydratase PrpD